MQQPCRPGHLWEQTVQRSTHQCYDGAQQRPELALARQRRTGALHLGAAEAVTQAMLLALLAVRGVVSCDSIVRPALEGFDESPCQAMQVIHDKQKGSSAACHRVW